MKYLVRIDIDVMDRNPMEAIEPELTIKKVLRETEHMVFVGNERTSRVGTVVKTAGPFNKRQLGEIFGGRPGTRRVYFISEEEDPRKDPQYRSLTELMCAEIYTQLMLAGRALAEIRNGIIKG